MPGERGDLPDQMIQLALMVTRVLPCIMLTIREYLDPNGHSAFAKWFSGLNAPAAAKVTTSLVRIEQGKFSNTKGVGAGVFEYRVDFGPGYRIYFGKDGDALVILVGGGTKKGQDSDIKVAHERWKDYKERKAREI
jgi:putative addiction module killer protein